jgi:hypothetical protein
MAIEGAPPFRVTVLFATGEPREFPYYLDAAERTIRDSARGRVQFDIKVLEDNIHERGYLFEALHAVFAQLLRHEDSVINLVDDRGAWWLLPLRTIVGIAIEDPHRRGEPQIGFRLVEDSN